MIFWCHYNSRSDFVNPRKVGAIGTIWVLSDCNIILCSVEVILHDCPVAHTSLTVWLGSLSSATHWLWLWAIFTFFCKIWVIKVSFFFFLFSGCSTVSEWDILCLDFPGVVFVEFTLTVVFIVTKWRDIHTTPNTYLLRGNSDSYPLSGPHPSSMRKTSRVKGQMAGESMWFFTVPSKVRHRPSHL